MLAMRCRIEVALQVMARDRLRLWLLGLQKEEEWAVPVLQ